MFSASNSQLLLMVVVLVVSLVSLPLTVAAAIAAASLPDTAWNAAGRSRLAWVVALSLFALFCLPLGAITAIGYFVRIRPEVRAHLPPLPSGSSS